MKKNIFISLTAVLLGILVWGLFAPYSPESSPESSPKLFVSDPAAFKQAEAETQRGQQPVTANPQEAIHSTMPSASQPLPKLAATAEKNMICQPKADGCIANTELNYDRVLMLNEADLNANAAQVVLTAQNFSAVIDTLASTKSAPEAFENEQKLQNYLNQQVNQFPGGVVQSRCGDQVCLMELDVDADTPIAKIEQIFASSNWPAGSTVEWPQTNDHRLKYRVLARSSHITGAGVSYSTK